MEDKALERILEAIIQVHIEIVLVLIEEAQSAIFSDDADTRKAGIVMIEDASEYLSEITKLLK